MRVSYVRVFFFCFTPPAVSSQRVVESSEACADYAVMVNRGDAVGSDDWRELPIEQQMAFRIPISTMINLPHLRAHQPVITVSEYLRLHGLDRRPSRVEDPGTENYITPTQTSSSLKRQRCHRCSSSRISGTNRLALTESIIFRR